MDILGEEAEGDVDVTTFARSLSETDKSACAHSTGTHGHGLTQPQRQRQSQPLAFVFSPLDPVCKIWELKNLAIPAPTHSKLPGFDADKIDYILKLFGDGFGTPEPTLTLHQGIVLMEIMKSFYGREILYINFDDLVPTILQHGARHPLLGSRPRVIFLYHTTGRSQLGTARSAFPRIDGTSQGPRPPDISMSVGISVGG